MNSTILLNIVITFSFIFIFGLGYLCEYLMVVYKRNETKIERFGRKLEFIIISRAIAWEMIVKAKIIQTHQKISNQLHNN